MTCGFSRPGSSNLSFCSLSFIFPLEHVKGLSVLDLDISNSSCPTLCKDLDAAKLWHSSYSCLKAETLCSSYHHLVQSFPHLYPIFLHSKLTKKKKQKTYPQLTLRGLCPWQLDVAALQKELDKSQSVFSGNPSVWLKDLASYLNYKLQAPLSEPTLSQHTHG